MRLQHIYNHNKRGMHYLDSKTVFFYLMVTIPQKKFDPHFLQQSHHPHNLNTGYKKNKKLFPYGSLNFMGHGDWWRKPALRASDW